MERSIFDHRSNRAFSVLGLATFTDRSADYLYEEAGHLKHERGTSVVSRRYVLSSEHDRLTVSFEDGDFFFAIKPPLAEMTQLRHDCGEDTYSGSIAIFRSSWSITWIVRGSLKHYVSKTTYLASTKALDQHRSYSGS